MSILNNFNDSLKTREVKNISSLYKLQNKTDTEKIDDFILIGNFSHNIILKSIKLSTEKVLTGLVGDIVILDKDKNEIKYFDSSQVEHTLSPLAEDVAFVKSSAEIKDKEILDNSMKFKTLEEYILSEDTERKSFSEPIFIAIKITTAPTSPVVDGKILAEIDFIEKI